MQRYFIDEKEFNSKTINEGDCHHIINVMRMKNDDKIEVAYDRKVYLASITIDSKQVFFDIIEDITDLTELPFYVTLGQGFAKGDKMDSICQKATELGVNSFLPIMMERSIVRLENDKLLAKQIRFSKIMKEAAEQTHRNKAPECLPVIDLKRINFSEYDYVIVAYEELAGSKGFKELVKSFKNDDKILLIIGPEGGISPKEIEFLKTKNAYLVGLGPRILRTETAGIYMLSAISYERE